MVAAGQVDLVDWAIFFAPICELDKTVLFRYIRYGANNWIACNDL
jgi:hypothetical protein